MSPDRKKKIKRIIARESLIVIVIAVILFLAGFLFFAKMAFKAPQYKLELADGTVHYLSITPDTKDIGSMSDKEMLRTFYKPSTSLILKRIEEFNKINEVKIINASPYTSWEERILKIILHFVTLGIFLQIAYIYLFVLLIRFILWAIRTLKEKE